jgi:DNA mismatch endonuclease (patch repair protein)
MDTVSSKRRSEIMSRIRSKNTGPEMVVRRLTYAMGFRFRLHGKDLPGKPDLVFKSKRKAIFVHGCFWHLHKNCADGRIPKSNRLYWRAKLLKNVFRDKSNRRKLTKMGWSSLVIWECMTLDERKLRRKMGAFLNRNDSA